MTKPHKTPDMTDWLNLYDKRDSLYTMTTQYQSSFGPAGVLQKLTTQPNVETDCLTSRLTQHKQACKKIPCHQSSVKEY